MKVQPTVLNQIAALENAEFGILKKQYLDLFGKPPPSRNRKQIIARLAYRIQEIAYGGLSAEARERLSSIYDTHGMIGKLNESSSAKKHTPTPGTKLVREYLGERHEIVVLDKGFQYRDGVYKSLSSIAKEITGSHMSGPAFFGIKKKG